MRLPVVNPREVNFEELVIPADGLWRFITTGVSGNVKAIYRDIGTIVGYPEEMDETLRNHDVVFLHSRRREGESYYETHDVNHKRMYPDGIFAEYGNREELLGYVQQGEVLFIIEYPLMAEWICFQLETALENKEIFPEDLLKKKMYLELSGEPVTETEVQAVVGRLEKIFQCRVEHFLTYGSNEIGHIGTYIPSLHGPEIVYEIIPSLFVEEIDGEIIITPFKNNGTILFRYKTGDKGKLSFKNDRLLLKYLRKSKGEGVVYVAGEQVNVAELVIQTENILRLPSSLEFNKKENPKTGTCELGIVVHTPKPLDNSVKGSLEKRVRDFVMKSAVLEVENHLKVVKIKVDYTTIPLKKRWIIREID